MIIGATIAAVIISAFAYRIGGMSKEEAAEKLPWVSAFLIKGSVRDIVCTSVVTGWAYLFLDRVDPIRYLYSGVAMLVAIRTYWDWWPPNKGKDNYFMHGLGIGLALLPIAHESGIWIEVIARAFILGFLMRVWCTVFSDVDMEEYGRGAFIALTLPLLLAEFLAELL